MRPILKSLAGKKALFVFIILLAGVFRVVWMQYVEFKGDEALNLFLASRPLFHHPFPPAAQASSAGILNFPLLNYLLFPIIIFTTYPPIISLIIAILNTLTIGGFFLLFTKYHGRLTAFLASCIMALSPWAILYSRKIWAQDFLLPLSLPFFISVYKIREGKKLYWLLFGISSMLLLQIHQIAIFIPLLIFIALFKKALASWKLLLLGILLGLIPAIPYFWYVASHMCFSCQNTLAARLSLRSILTLLRPLQILSIGNFHVEFGDDFAKFAVLFPLIYKTSKLSYISYALLPLGIFFFWVKNSVYRFLAIVCIAYLFLLFLFGIEPLMHYYILLIPFLALFVGYVLARSMQTKKLQFFGIGIALVYLLSLASFDYGFLAFLSQKGGLAGDYGAGFATSEQGANSALKKFKNYANYAELQLMYFSSFEYFHGYMPLGQMIFPYAELAKDESEREKQFILFPTNPLLATEVFAFYTQSQDPSWQSVVALKEKTRIYGMYDFIYEKVLNEYESMHFKNLYETPDFLLLYPRHWQSNPIQDGIILSDRQVSITVVKLLIPNLFIPDINPTTSADVTIAGKAVTETTCTTLSGLWCGTLDAPVLLRANRYVFEVKPTADKATNNAANKAYGLQVLHEITQSAIPLD